VTLSGYTGTIVKWQRSTNDGVTWTDITNTTTSYTATNLTQTTKFRAVILNTGLCVNSFNTSEATVTVSVTPIAVFATANNITVDSSNVGNAWSRANLAGGADETVTMNVPTYAYQTGASSANPFQEQGHDVTTLFSSGFLKNVISQFDNAKRQSEVDKKVSEWASKEFDKATKADEDKATIESFAVMRHYYTLITMLQQIQDADRAFLRAVSGG